MLNTGRNERNIGRNRQNIGRSKQNIGRNEQNIGRNKQNIAKSGENQGEAPKRRFGKADGFWMAFGGPAECAEPSNYDFSEILNRPLICSV